MQKRIIIILFLVLLLAILAGCQEASAPSISSGKLNILATTSIVGDVVRNVGGDAIELTVLLPIDSDPHSFEPVPQDLARLERADLIFANGAGLEEFLLRILDSGAGREKLVSLSDSLELIAGESHTGDDPGEHTGSDPHVWTDPTLVASWVDQIEESLSQADPAHTAVYRENAAEYRQALTELDGWIQAQVSQIPVERRKLVTDHETFAYFGRRYGFDTVGAVFPGFSTLAEPSARELADLENRIRDLNVGAIFVDQAANQALSQRVSQDTGIRLVPVYSGSLSGPDEDASTYLDFMRFNTNAIVSALK